MNKLLSRTNVSTAEAEMLITPVTISLYFLLIWIIQYNDSYPPTKPTAMYNV